MNPKLLKFMTTYPPTLMVTAVTTAIILFVTGAVALYTHRLHGLLSLVLAVLLAASAYKEWRGKSKVVPEQYHFTQP
jgi:hypothetical protein